MNFDNGFLQNPDGKWGTILNPDVKRIEEFGSHPCLILLGEPGLGKSSEVKRNEELISAVGRKDVQSLIINLSSYDSVERFERNVFQSNEFKTWRAGGDSILNLTLESFDECLIRAEALTSFLLDEFSSLPLERLFLRIVCRTGYWPAVLEQGLLTLYPKDTVKILELMPLRRQDVMRAATDEGLDVKTFMEGIFATGITAFAARPITLLTLIHRFKRTGELPKNQVEMYQQGSLKLCDEVNELRRGKKTAGQLPSQQKMVIAGRTAATLMFSNNSTLWTLPDDGNMPDGAMSIETIFGFDELDGQPILVDQRSVMETLATGLFSARGQNQMGWSHQTYGEFLAADYLLRHSVDENRILSLIARPEGRLIPKLYSVAAWIAVMNRRIFEIIMKNEPEILLLGDITATTESQKFALTELYLSCIAASNAVDFGMRTNFRYDRLKHAALVDQIRPYITNRSANENARIEAMFITEACHVQELGTLLVDIALNCDESVNIRAMAAFVVSRIAKSDDRARLKPLICDSIIDRIDQLRGYALTATWPEHLTAEELFSVLTPPKRSNYAGGYTAFLSEKLVPGLNPSDLPIALQWVLEQPEERRRHLAPRFEQLPDNILLYAWANIEIPGVLELFAKVVLRRTRAHEDIIGDRYRDNTFKFNAEDDTKRRLLVEKLVVMLDPEKDNGYELIMSRPPLVSIDDIEWLFIKINQTTDEPIGQQRLWAHLLNWVWNWSGSSRDITDKIYNIYKTTPSLANIFTMSFEAVDLASDQARIGREHYELEKKYEKRKKAEANASKLKVDKLIKEQLDRLEQGENDAWWTLIHKMAFRPDGSHADAHATDITTLPGWALLDEPTKEKFAGFAESYLLTQKPKASNDPRTFYQTDSAAYKALFYLKIHSVKMYDLLTLTIWEKWATIIVQYPIWADRDNMPMHQQLIQSVYNKVPQEVCKCLGRYINNENKQGGNLDFLDKFDLCYDKALCSFLLKKAKGKAITTNTLSSLLCKLIDLRFDKALLYSRKLVCSLNKDKAALIAASALLFHSPVSEWEFIWTKIKSDVAFGKTFMLQVAGYFEYKKSFTDKLSEMQLADLYVWLATNFPHKEDPYHDGVFNPTARDQMIHFRDGVLETLKLRGNDLSCEAIERILRELPELDWLASSLEKAKKIRVEKAWIPPSPQEVLSLVQNSNSRLVKDGDQLLGVVTEALQRIQSKLQGETPLAPFLWDQVVKRPKWENDFSDFIVSQLRDELANRGIILNREVEIRSNRSGVEGERTDIHIDAISSTNSHDVLKVIVEAKGCWHDELTTAMETQLLGKYLRDNDCKHGLYLVGWFNCPQWDKKDSRRRKAFHHDLESLTTVLNSQAIKLSEGGSNIRVVILDASLRHSPV
ncbi:NACHT domain-containing protein [Pelosinus baikalensis]|uniref:NACHT domain-containing protein n=1 Tax=Pelosinus baikalensis TaxID=2892015 RepID=UPI001E359D54|nr:hypothetical protein [Pelosinus baikalensis]